MGNSILIVQICNFIIIILNKNINMLTVKLYVITCNVIIFLV